MIIRIESSVTIQIEENNYLKEFRSLEMDHRDIISLLSMDEGMAERYGDLAEDDPLTVNAVQEAFLIGFDAVKFPLWEALDMQMDELLPPDDDDEE